MHQDLILHPLLDTLHVRHFAEILVQCAKVKHCGPFVVGLLRVVIKDNLAVELMHPYWRKEVHRVLMFRVFGDIVENLILKSLDKSD